MTYVGSAMLNLDFRTEMGSEVKYYVYEFTGA